VVESLRPGLPALKTMIGFDGPADGVLDYETLLADAAPREEEADVEDDETTILMFTSGTTSLPKGVMLTSGDFTAYVTANVELADGTPRGAALLCAPLYHIAGATNMMTTLWTGRRHVVMPQFEV
jgi:acyl-CoA synthetase (AMP-forming)/AMP-acid ligase II